MQKYNLCNDSSNCSGCTACMNICPKNAITMQENSKGFLEPVIDLSKCIECKLCEKVCDFKKEKISSGKLPITYAVKHRDENEIKTSRSGAFFMAIAKYVINQNGVVYGCYIDENLYVSHKRAITYEECMSFKGSKYVQSDLKNTFNECKQDLLNNKIVLFSGTGCQIGGLISFLEISKINTKNLITIDIICHGVPSNQMFSQYIKSMEMKTNDKITKYDFRNKQINGWRDHIETIYFENNKKINCKNWTDMYYSHIIFRDSCYNCNYTTIYRKSDFTIADYWGIENNVPEFNDNKGVSLVIINNIKAKDIFEKLKPFLLCVETNIKTSMQNQLKMPIKKGLGYNRFWRKYIKNNYKTVNEYFFPSKTKKMKRLIVKKIKKHVKTAFNILNNLKKITKGNKK